MVEAVRPAYLQKLNSEQIATAVAREYVICGCPLSACTESGFFSKPWMHVSSSRRHWNKAREADPGLDVPTVKNLQHSAKYTTPDLYMDLYALHLGGLLEASITDACLHVEALQGDFTTEQLQFLHKLKQLPSDGDSDGHDGGLMEGGGADEGADEGADADADGLLEEDGDMQVRGRTAAM